MTICAKFDGRHIRDCTRGEGCICRKEQRGFRMFYAERYGDQSKGEPYIAERGVFYSIAEFVPYRALGWSGTAETDLLADAYLFELGAQGLNHAR
jgi:hypothetical protein